MRLVFLRVLLFALLLSGQAVSAGWARDMQFRTSDGVRLHIIEAGDPARNTIVFVPGWTMPAWIFQGQIAHFAARYHVVALDPRGQGESDVPEGGYDVRRRGRDIAELIAALGNRPVVLVGWSLGVLDSLGYIAQYGDERVAGLVLIDNSIGEDPAPVPSRAPRIRGPVLSREAKMRSFVKGMFARDPGPDYLERLTDDALRTPPAAAAALGNYAEPRTFWKETIYSVAKPILYIVRPRFAAQANNLAAKDPLAEISVFATAGHALFVDEAPRFNGLLDDFIQRRVWPR